MKLVDDLMIYEEIVTAADTFALCDWGETHRQTNSIEVSVILFLARI